MNRLYNTGPAHDGLFPPLEWREQVAGEQGNGGAGEPNGWTDGHHEKDICSIIGVGNSNASPTTL